MMWSWLTILDVDESKQVIIDDYIHCKDLQPVFDHQPGVLKGSMFLFESNGWSGRLGTHGLRTSLFSSDHSGVLLWFQQFFHLPPENLPIHSCSQPKKVGHIRNPIICIRVRCVVSLDHLGFLKYAFHMLRWLLSMQSDSRPCSKSQPPDLGCP